MSSSSSSFESLSPFSGESDLCDNFTGSVKLGSALIGFVQQDFWHSLDCNWEWYHLQHDSFQLLYVPLVLLLVQVLIVHYNERMMIMKSNRVLPSGLTTIFRTGSPLSEKIKTKINVTVLQSCHHHHQNRVFLQTCHPSISSSSLLSSSEEKFSIKSHCSLGS